MKVYHRPPWSDVGIQQADYRLLRQMHRGCAVNTCALELK